MKMTVITCANGYRREGGGKEKAVNRKLSANIIDTLSCNNN